jgi:hypothetical protein
LRELRGVWPLAAPALDGRVAACAALHLGLVDDRAHDQLGSLCAVARTAGVEPRDLEGALVSVALAHRGVFGACPGGRDCTALSHRVARH